MQFNKSAYDFLLAFHSNCEPISHIVSETQWDTGWKSQIFGTHLYLAPLLGVTVGILQSGLPRKKTEWLGHQPMKKFDGKFSHFDTIHQLDGQTDTAGQQRPRYAASRGKNCCNQSLCFL